MDIQNIRYEINKEKRETVCVLTSKRLNNSNYRLVTIGKTVCLPEDEWNEEIGKEIALMKAKKKVLKYDIIGLKEELKRNFRSQDELEKKCQKIVKELIHAESYIDKLEKKIKIKSNI